MTREQTDASASIFLGASDLFEVKFAGGDGLIEGYASTFGGEPDSHGDIVAPGAFTDSLRKHRGDGSMPAMLWGHDRAKPIGKWQSAIEDARGLRVEGRFNLDTRDGREAYKHAKHGDVTGLSIGFSRATRVASPDGKSRILTKAHVHEISLTPIPSNGSARLVEVKQIASRSELEDALRDTLGLPRAAARRIAAGGWPALADEPATAPDGDPEAKALADLLRRSTLEFRSLNGKR